MRFRFERLKRLGVFAFSHSQDPKRTADMCVSKAGFPTVYVGSIYAGCARWHSNIGHFLISYFEELECSGSV